MKKIILILTSLLFIWSCSNNNEENGTQDTTAPVIILLGNAIVDIVLEDSYIDAGATATDNFDGNLTSSIVVNNTVDTNVLGTYIVSYDVDDSSGNAATTVTRIVNVVPAAFATASINYNNPFDLETDTEGIPLTCGQFPVDIYFQYVAETTTNARLYFCSGFTDMAQVYDRSFDEITFSKISDYYFCIFEGDPNIACDNLFTPPVDFVAILFTREGNYFAVEYISETTQNVTFRYKLLE